ncbi:hypothetical protein BDV95DRAFT_164798 [Massariosphaeria phaeospora]|uniref:C2H2-type domain-containing protein n=1 Tax=Massariosphaeria phaeospora TaxID=100035 RepID=A0A7C8M2A5_9PLEO|nr:hypothetical protein BDV95DRAFT_164798 [Massariosphaeria phaeospora]
MKDGAVVESAKGVLQDLVVVVSLVRTLTESFGSASDLYRTLKRKRKESDDTEHESPERRRPLIQRHRDSDSDHDIRRAGRLQWRDKSKDRSRSRSKKRDHSDSDGESIETSSSMVRAEYERGYHYLGDKFAQGDLITQNQLQSQIIALQQTLLNIYQELSPSKHSTSHPSSYHLARLKETARAARSASIQALALQYKRMLPPPSHHHYYQHPVEMANGLPQPPGAFPSSMSDSHELVLRRKKSRIRNRSRSSSSDSGHTRMKLPISRPKPIHTPTSRSLYCPYARDLQNHTDQPLADAYKPGGDSLCPYCRLCIPTKPGKAWEIVKQYDGKRDIARRFLIGNRFAIKCHREGGGFACVLCSRFREADTVCGDLRALVEHVWDEHGVGDLEADGDIGEAR